MFAVSRAARNAAAHSRLRHDTHVIPVSTRLPVRQISVRGVVIGGIRGTINGYRQVKATVGGAVAEAVAPIKAAKQEKATLKVEFKKKQQERLQRQYEEAKVQVDAEMKAANEAKPAEEDTLAGRRRRRGADMVNPPFDVNKVQAFWDEIMVSVEDFSSGVWNKVAPYTPLRSSLGIRFILALQREWRNLLEVLPGKSTRYSAPVPTLDDWKPIMVGRGSFLEALNVHLQQEDLAKAKRRAAIRLRRKQIANGEPVTTPEEAAAAAMAAAAAAASNATAAATATAALGAAATTTTTAKAPAAPAAAAQPAAPAADMAQATPEAAAGEGVATGEPGAEGETPEGEVDPRTTALMHVETRTVWGRRIDSLKNKLRTTVGLPAEQLATTVKAKVSSYPQGQALMDLVAERAKTVSEFREEVKLAASDVREVYENSESPVIAQMRRAGDFLANPSETSHALTVLKQLDPTFNLARFERDMELFYAPLLAESFLAGDLAKLSLICKGQALAMSKAVIALRQQEGKFLDKTILDIRNLEMSQVTLVEERPLLLVTFMAAHLHAVRDKTGKLLEGGGGSRRVTVYYVMVERDVEDQQIPWKIVEMSQHRLQALMAAQM